MKFVDLFAGLGGFHQALRRRGAVCVFASEIDSHLADLYEKNFGLRPQGDIRGVDIESIPDHDILCAGFPCQPFSKAGDQKGLECPQWGNLFDYVVAILQIKQPRFFIIENVPNLIKHNGGETWETICAQLREHYHIDYTRLSPHMFGIPQKRERAFIIGDREGLAGFDWQIPERLPEISIRSILDNNPADAHALNENHITYLETWQEFIAAFPKNQDLPSFPIWAMEFGADYPLDGLTPHKRGYQGLDEYRGAFGQPLRGLSAEAVHDALPGYARTELTKFPEWKINFIQKNRDFYSRHKTLIDRWIHKIREFPSSFQKLEWNCKGGERVIWQHLLQFRASGIRVKKDDTAPSLIAMTTSQVPIVAWQQRYMTPRECSRLQSMGALRYLPDSKNGAYKAFGNAVNVDVILHIYDALTSRSALKERETIALAVE